MNIFVLDTDPVEAAQLQCDKHVVKMVLESAQMLSTAHRLIDGTMYKAPSKSGKTMVKHWKHDDPTIGITNTSLHYVMNTRIGMAKHILLILSYVKLLNLHHTIYTRVHKHHFV